MLLAGVGDLIREQVSALVLAMPVSAPAPASGVGDLIWEQVGVAASLVAVATAWARMRLRP